MANNAQKAAVLEEVIEHIHRLHEDVRAEVVVGELLDNQVQQESVTVQMKNVFTRAFARDILGARLDDSQPYHPFIALQLSRDGLYDRLPEGLFHDFSSQRRGSVNEMVANYKKQQQQQQHARKFFQPLEHEFFLQRVFLEQREKHLLFDAFGKDADLLFRSFWGISPNLPQAATNRLVRLLPYMHRIAGNIPLVTLCLQVILEENVHIVCEHTSRSVQSSSGIPLGECRLGMDTLAGEDFFTDMPVMKVTIGPLQNQRVYDYLPWQPYGQLLETCYNFLLPADVDVETLLEPNPAEKGAAIADADRKEGIMGYNVFL
ncbi:hypothetical protein F0L74_14665 [Chitinophaga agrisoli]|uniref:Type VI secretion system (T6SS) VasB/ImpH family protein n=1 Tax=Chitinophaga agrisoli TaxID=2607653 RepID=A0A5B2VYJ8_9BACT|nr:type VI secretion system baseplate subunit TssG [Chitinophaga agrisoli]KAA2243718.1 hypothetical protein F0L74_14665 [Chitinophaga agrisoli]